MKTPRASHSKHGFTLMELMVAMTITTIIVSVLVSITSIAIDTWNRSRSELRASRQAKAMVDAMARDFESLVVRSGNDYEWLSAVSDPPEESTNAATLVFFSAATDRYDGEVGKQGVDLGGDVSCVGYKLEWKDPIEGGTQGNFQTFVLNRLLVDPKPTFDKLLGQPDLAQLFRSGFDSELEMPEYFLCENVFQFTVTFHIQTSTGQEGAAQTEEKLVTVGPSGGVQQFRITGRGIETLPESPELVDGKITAVDISLSVITDAGVDLLRKNPAKAKDAAWLAKNSYQYSKLVRLPGM